MVQSLPGFLNLSLNVCSPCQVLGDVYTEVLEAAHPLHRGPTDHKRSVGPLLSLPEVHDQLFGFAHVQREAVVLAPCCKSLHLIQVCGLVVVVNEAQDHSIIRKYKNTWRLHVCRLTLIMWCCKFTSQHALQHTWITWYFVYLTKCWFIIIVFCLHFVL